MSWSRSLERLCLGLETVFSLSWSRLGLMAQCLCVRSQCLGLGGYCLGLALTDCVPSLTHKLIKCQFHNNWSRVIVFTSLSSGNLFYSLLTILL